MKITIDIPEEIIRQAENREDSRKLVESGIELANGCVLVTEWKLEDASCN